ncbi:MAG TPA: ParB/RepB/Spo0J family partition protein [Beijerinckiaceae bacterium]|nr:ParB/RepB/Spo0J family partition protein [Beijerinckiaceae bacterium]
MVDETHRQRLGRGLAALIGDVGGEERSERMPRRASVAFLRANPNNPRRTFTELEIEELTASVREKGILQPILVRAISGVPDQFEIIAGERRWRAAQRAGLHEVPILVVEADDRQALELAIIENVQRADLNPLEEARGYESLLTQFGYTQADLSRVVGKSRSHVANTLRLSRLPDSVKSLLSEGKLSAGHGRALLAVADPEGIAKRVLAQGLTVRDVERLAQREVEDAETGVSPRPRPEKDADTRALEKALGDILGLPVSIDHRREGGALTVRYRSLEQLDALCRRLRGA